MAKKKKSEELIDILTKAAEQLDVKVRCEVLKGVGGMPVSSGLARVDDKWVIFLEKRQPPRQRLEALLDALNNFDLSGIDLPPQAAAYFERR